MPPGSQLMLVFPREGKKQISSTFLIIGEDRDAQGRDWYQIRLPIRPNGSTGWVRATEVTTATVMYSMSIDLSDHRLDLYEAGQLKNSYPVGVGTGDNPTPPGEYYITIKMKPTNPNSVYGVLAMGVSGFSEKLTDWPEGGQLGIHGTNDPSSVGRDVSHGCIRLQNEDILDLSPYVAYGTPGVGPGVVRKLRAPSEPRHSGDGTPATDAVSSSVTPLLRPGTVWPPPRQYIIDMSCLVMYKSASKAVPTSGVGWRIAFNSAEDRCEFERPRA